MQEGQPTSLTNDIALQELLAPTEKVVENERLEKEAWEKFQETLRIQREGVQAELKRAREEQPKTRKKTQFLYDLFPYIPFIFNPANGILVAALAFSIAAILAAAAPQLLAAAAPALLCVAAGGLIFSAVTIIPFTIWEGIKHYNEWRLEQSDFSSDYDPNLDEEVVKNDPYVGTFDHYQSTLLFAKPNYKSSLNSQLGQWSRDHYWQAMIVTLGILFSAALIGLCAQFFLGNPVCFDLLHPVFALFQSIFAAGIPSLYLPFLAVFADPAVIEIITAVFITALPLIIADNVRRMMQAVAFYHPPKPIVTQETKLHDVTVEKPTEDESKEEHYVLFNVLKDNSDTRTWNYLVGVFDHSGKIGQTENQDVSDLNFEYDHDVDDFKVPAGGQDQTVSTQNN